MWNIADIKAKGREAFKLNYWPCVIVSAIYTLLLGGNAARGTSSLRPDTTALDVQVNGQTLESATQGMSNEQVAAIAGVTFVALLFALGVAFLVKAFLINPVEVGANRFFKNNIHDQTTGVGVITEGFSDFGRTFLTLLLRDLFIGLGCVVFVIPGLVLMYAFRMVPFIVKDNPELGPMDVLKRSYQMMQGSKWQSFLLDLSFIGWYLVGIVTFGLGMIFWTSPYTMSANAALYEELKGNVA